MSEYLTYHLWRQREERMPHELEHQRVVEERLREQELERQLAVSSQLEVAEAPITADVLDCDEYVLVDE
jgi:hypothetical protein